MTDLTNSFVCCSCHQVPASAVESACCHSLFCWDCGISKAKTPCPACSRTLSPEEFKENIIVNRVLATLQVRCRFDGCNEMLSAAERRFHEASCPFATVMCPNAESCGFLTRYDLSHHLEICPNRDVQCHKCEGHVRLTDLQNHLVDSCANVDIACPRGCDVTIRRADIALHQTVCEYEFIACPLAPLCTARFMRGEMQNHVSANISDHLTRVLEHSRAQDQEILQLRSRVTLLESAPRSSEVLNPRAVAYFNQAVLLFCAFAAFCASLPVRATTRHVWRFLMPLITGYFTLFMIFTRGAFWVLPRWQARWVRTLFSFFLVGRIVFWGFKRSRHYLPRVVRVPAVFCCCFIGVVFAVLVHELLLFF